MPLSSLFSEPEKEQNGADEASSEVEPVAVEVEWSRVHGATRYLLQIRSMDGNIVFEKETEQTKLLVRLPPGNYSKRLGLINKFNRLYLRTDWRPLRIIRVLEPEIELAAPVGPIPRGGGRRQVRLKPTGEMAQTRYYLLDATGQKRYPKTRKQAGEVILDIDPDSMPPGEYDLVMENPQGKRDVKKRLIIIDRSAAEKAELRRKNLRYGLLIPGIPQRDRGQTLKGNSLMIAFFGSLAFTAYSYHRATTIYSQLQSDPVYGLAKDPAIMASLDSQLPSSQAIYLAAIAGYGGWQASTSTYNRFRLYYYAGAALTAGLYAYHLVDVYRFDIAMTQTANGQPAIRTGLTWRF